MKFFHVSPELTKTSHKLMYRFRWVRSWCLMGCRDLSSGVSNVFMGLGNRQPASQWRPRRISTVHVWRMFSTSQAASLATAVQTAGPERRWGAEGRVRERRRRPGGSSGESGELGKGQTGWGSQECGNCPGKHVRNALKMDIILQPDRLRERAACVNMCVCVCASVDGNMC